MDHVVVDAILRIRRDRLAAIQAGEVGPAYPFWSLMIIAVDVVALYGLCAYGSRENLAA